ncbi:MAG: 2Fe-2S iron-sulfur cluster-binding protein [Prolixibacteraceae bacterium]|nr:2Fe-2S iron-sulfur cluster-binding protein [Prolixibacteraceae bacterium]
MNDKVTITLLPLGKAITVNRGTPLIDILNDYGVEFPCGGKGTCGRCKVKLLAGELNPGVEQQQKLKKLGLEKEWRLACYCLADSDLTLEVAEFETIILADNTTFDFVPQEGYGIAVDLGTTTVVVQLVNLMNGHIVDSVSFLNRQMKFGSDLISRIQSCLDGNQTEMQSIIREDIGSVIMKMQGKIRTDIKRIVIVGNTVMHHIFSGLNVQPLSFYPFESPDPGIRRFSPGS